MIRRSDSLDSIIFYSSGFKYRISTALANSINQEELEQAVLFLFKYKCDIGSSIN